MLQCVSPDSDLIVLKKLAERDVRRERHAVRIHLHLQQQQKQQQQHKQRTPNQTNFRHIFKRSRSPSKGEIHRGTLESHRKKVIDGRTLFVRRLSAKTSTQTSKYSLRIRFWGETQIRIWHLEEGFWYYHRSGSSPTWKVPWKRSFSKLEVSVKMFQNFVPKFCSKKYMLVLKWNI